MPKAVITGGTGFIGRALAQCLLKDGYEVVCLTRNADRAKKTLDPRIRPLGWDGRSAAGWEKEVDGASAVVNLAGSSIGAGRWTGTAREKIRNSRVQAGRAVAEAVRLAKNKPKVVIQASAVGYYPHRANQILTEDSGSGDGFLSSVCREWEDSSIGLESPSARRVIIRTGLVLGEGGLLRRMITPMRLFIGGPLGSGRQWMSWIHINDEVEAIRFLMESGLEGVFNLVSPNPIRNKDLCRALGKVMKRPCWFPMPAPLLRLVFGRMAVETILSSQPVIPRRLEQAGYSFQFPGTEEALDDIFKKQD